jgi:hypothetical protein
MCHNLSHFTTCEPSIIVSLTYYPTVSSSALTLTFHFTTVANWRLSSQTFNANPTRLGYNLYRYSYTRQSSEYKLRKALWQSVQKGGEMGTWGKHGGRVMMGENSCDEQTGWSAGYGVILDAFLITIYLWYSVTQ